MADTRRSALPGQITAPNPLEIYWEKNRKPILAALILFGGILGGWYGYKAFQRHRVNEAWLGFSRATELRNELTADGEWDSLRRMQGGQGLFWWISQTRESLVSALPTRLRQMNDAELRQELEQKRGTDQEPYLLWVLANALRLDGDSAGAKEVAHELQRKFPEHSLCKPVEWPPVYVPTEAGEIKEPSGRKRTPPPDRPPEPASCVQLLLKSIERDQAFVASHPALFEPPKPDPSPTVVFKIQTPDGERTVKIGFFAKEAPKTVEHFLKKVESGFYKDLRVHYLQKKSSALGRSDAANYFAIGNAETGNSDDRTKWSVEQKPQEPIPLEKNRLSLFPGMVAAPPVPGLAPDERKAHSELIRIYAADASLDTSENDVVVFGRVIEGLDVVTQIVQSPFNTQRETEDGRGVPRDLITIKSATVER